MNITHGLRRALQINPRGIAILEGERRLTWAEVGERVGSFAGALRKLGVAKGDRVAVLMLNSGRYLELYLAVGWAGAVIVPLNIRWSVAENRDAFALRQGSESYSAPVSPWRASADRNLSAIPMLGGFSLQKGTRLLGLPGAAAVNTPLVDVSPLVDRAAHPTACLVEGEVIDHQTVCLGHCS
jgi:non-ribosomal peptide synthetase component F